MSRLTFVRGAGPYHQLGIGTEPSRWESIALRTAVAQPAQKPRREGVGEQLNPLVLRPRDPGGASSTKEAYARAASRRTLSRASQVSWQYRKPQVAYSFSGERRARQLAVQNNDAGRALDSEFENKPTSTC